MKEIIAQISARRPKPFSAGLILRDDVVVDAAPILRFMQRNHFTLAHVREYCRERDWNLTVISDG